MASILLDLPDIPGAIILLNSWLQFNGRNDVNHDMGAVVSQARPSRDAVHLFFAGSMSLCQEGNVWEDLMAEWKSPSRRRDW